MNLTPAEKLYKLRDYIDQQKKIDKYVILNKVKDLFKEVNYEKTPFDYRIAALRRAVIHRDELWFDNVSKFGIAPKNCVGLGRCNWPKEPVFYGSNDNGVPIFECRAKNRIGQFIAMSSWINNYNSTDEIEAPIGFQGITLGVERVVEALKDGDIFKELLLKDDIFKPSTPQQIKDFDRSIGELFSEPGSENLYWITSAISKVYLNHFGVVQGFIYPSVESIDTGTNVVFSEKFANANLRLYGVAMYRTLDYNDSKEEYTIEAIKSLCGSYLPHNDKSKPQWQKIHQKHKGECWILSTKSPITSWVDDPSVLTLEDECI